MTTNKYGREEFMAFFRSDAFHEELTPDDCAEVFRSVLHGGADITFDLLRETCSDYSVDLVALTQVGTL